MVVFGAMMQRMGHFGEGTPGRRCLWSEKLITKHLPLRAGIQRSGTHCAQIPPPSP